MCRYFVQEKRDQFKQKRVEPVKLARLEEDISDLNGVHSLINVMEQLIHAFQTFLEMQRSWKSSMV